MSADETLLEVTGLSSGYGPMTAVSDVSFRLSRGEVVALFGPNGAGKSTSLLSTVGLLPRRTGSVVWAGRLAPKTLHGCVRAGLSFVPEKRSIIASLSTLENLKLGRGSVADALTDFPELADHLHRPAGLLSGGQQQILILARALAARPQALLVDELSLGLAPAVVSRLLTVLRAAAADRGLAVLLVEQQMKRALAVADRWYFMSHGSISAEGPASDAGIIELQNAYRRKVGMAGPDVPAAPL
jgi:branched-chain amino acid transport system ATP-binding protein